MSNTTKLTEAERDCLRLVTKGYNSKEIAGTLGISSHTVDARLKRAIQKLDAQNRFAAARILAEEDDPTSYQPLIYQPPDVPAPVDSAIVAPSPPAAMVLDGAERTLQVEEVQAPYVVEQPAPPPEWSLPLRRSRTNDLTSKQRLIWILAIALGIMLTTGVFLAGLDAAGRIISSILTKH